MVHETTLFRLACDTNQLNWSNLSQYLASKNHILDPEFVPQQFAGGLGNWNFLVRVDNTLYVLRRPPAGPLPIGANDMGREHRVLSRLSSVFPLAPRTLLYCEDASIIGAPFQLIEYRCGVVIRNTIPDVFKEIPDYPEQLTNATLDVLVKLHGINPCTSGLDAIGRPIGMVDRQMANWTRRATEAFHSGLPPDLATVLRWLQQPAPVPQRVCMLHSDFKMDNIIFDSFTVRPVALIDWDMGTLGDPLLDLATLLSYWTEANDPDVMHELRQMPTALPGFPSRAEVLHEYSLRTGLSVGEFKYYRLLALVKLCVVFQQLYVRHCRGDQVPQHYATFGHLATNLADFANHVLQSEKS